MLQLWRQQFTEPRLAKSSHVCTSDCCIAFRCERYGGPHLHRQLDGHLLRRLRVSGYANLLMLQTR